MEDDAGADVADATPMRNPVMERHTLAALCVLYVWKMVFLRTQLTTRFLRDTLYLTTSEDTAAALQNATAPGADATLLGTSSSTPLIVKHFSVKAIMRMPFFAEFHTFCVYASGFVVAALVSEAVAWWTGRAQFIGVSLMISAVLLSAWPLLSTTAGATIEFESGTGSAARAVSTALQLGVFTLVGYLLLDLSEFFLALNGDAACREIAANLLAAVDGFEMFASVTAEAAAFYVKIATAALVAPLCLLSLKSGRWFGSVAYAAMNSTPNRPAEQTMSADPDAANKSGRAPLTSPYAYILGWPLVLWFAWLTPIHDAVIAAGGSIVALRTIRWLALAAYAALRIGFTRRIIANYLMFHAVAPARTLPRLLQVVGSAMGSVVMCVVPPLQLVLMAVFAATLIVSGDAANASLPLHAQAVLTEFCMLWVLVVQGVAVIAGIYSEFSVQNDAVERQERAKANMPYRRPKAQEAAPSSAKPATAQQRKGRK